MKTKNILLPALALLAGTLLSVPIFAQNLDYHDLEEINKSIAPLIEEIKTNIPVKSYLDVAQLLNQMNEDLPIDSSRLSEQAKNSIKDGKISDKDQYNLMAFAIQTNHNEVLKTLLTAGFKADLNSLTEIAQQLKNYEAIDLFNTYKPTNQNK